MLSRILQWFQGLWLRVTNSILLWMVPILERRGLLPTHHTRDPRLKEYDRRIAARQVRSDPDSEGTLSQWADRIRREPEGDSLLSKLAERFIDPRKLKPAYLNLRNDPTGKLREKAHANKIIAFQFARDSGTFLDPDHPVTTEEEMEERRRELRNHKF